MIIFLLLCLSIIFPHNILATPEFNVTQKLNYVVNQSGSAKVTQEIILTNKISQIYAKEYQITIHNTSIDSISGHDKFGNIIKSTKIENENTTVNLEFSNPVVGKDQNNQFFLNYNINNFAQKKGNTWEIIFPQFESQVVDATQTVELKVPASFGDLSFSSQTIFNSHLVGDQTIIQFTPRNDKSKIMFVFGNKQIFDFKLNYLLSNNQDFNQDLDIPIPPDTNLQTITLKDILPRPTAIHIDNDGNWLATYNLAPKTELEITVTGQAKIHSSAKNQMPIDEKTLTSSQKYWDLTPDDVLSLNQKLTTPKEIYDYVINTLNYNYSRIDNAIRVGAKQALIEPSNALCTEFTDLFISLSRLAGIPAREIEGYAYSNNSKIKPTNQGADILHAWPEYYDKKTNTWIQIDPTWEKTTNGIDFFHDLDLNHFAFVIHGTNSENPAPPGSYKKDNSSKSVFVEFATTPINPDFKNIELSIDKKNLTIINPNLFSIPPQTITLTNSNWNYTSPILPPLGKVTVPTPKTIWYKSLLPTNKNYSFNVIGNNQSQLTIVKINRQYYFNLTILIGTIILVLCLGGIILTTSPKKK